MPPSATPPPQLHHYSLSLEQWRLAELLKEVRFVLVAGSATRVEAQALYLCDQQVFGLGCQLERLTSAESRFRLLKVGRCLLSDHGMGAASMSIALHELFLMCRHAGVLDKITLIRFGTCGGIGVEPGTVCITERALDPLFQDFIELKICARLVRRPAVVDRASAEAYQRVAARALDKLGPGHPRFRVQLGATIASNDFYEEQGRTNGAICEHSEADKRHFLARASELGVINIEMESNHLAAMSHKCGVSSIVVCVALCNRLQTDEADLTLLEHVEFERRLFWLNAEFIKDRLE